MSRYFDLVNNHSPYKTQALTRAFLEALTILNFAMKNTYYGQQISQYSDHIAGTALKDNHFSTNHILQELFTITPKIAEEITIFTNYNLDVHFLFAKIKKFTVGLSKLFPSQKSRVVTAQYVNTLMTNVRITVQECAF